jgi:mannose-6-phosphate isomerase-like protein (cupin superfamily)
MSVVGKIWGTTEPLAQTPLCELHRIRVQPGGFCSVHKHHGRANGFYVIRGAIEVRVWSAGGAVTKTTILTPGDYFTVDPGHLHQFFSAHGAEVLELYYPVLRGDDIERINEGGIAP